MAWLRSKVKEFENKFSKFLGQNLLGLNSCTAALHLSPVINRLKRKKGISSSYDF